MQLVDCDGLYAVYVGVWSYEVTTMPLNKVRLNLVATTATAVHTVHAVTSISTVPTAIFTGADTSTSAAATDKAGATFDTDADSTS